MKFQGKSIIRNVFLGALFTTLTAGLIVAQVPAGARRPAAVPANYLITPFGYFHPSCVAHLAKGDELMQDEKVIRHANGTSAGMHVCAYPHYEADGLIVTGDKQVDKQPSIGHS